MREWKITISDFYGKKDILTSHRAEEIFKYFLEKLKVLNAIDMYNKGSFMPTQNTFTKEIVTKRYTLILYCPYTEIEILKRTKGSIKEDIFIERLQNVKETYFEGI